MLFNKPIKLFKMKNKNLFITEYSMKQWNKRIGKEKKLMIKDKKKVWKYSLKTPFKTI